MVNENKNTAYDKHIKIGEQNIDSEVFDEIILKGKMEYPSIIILTKLDIGRHTLHALKNSVELSEGKYNLHFTHGEKVMCIGKIDLDIDTIFRIESIMKRLDPTIKVCESMEDDFRDIVSKDLVHTMQIKI